MSTQPPPLARNSTLTIEKLSEGVEVARFDILGREYYMSRWMLADYLVLTKTPECLPSEAYFITAKSIGIEYRWQDSFLHSAKPFTYEGFLVAIKMKVNSRVEKNEYSLGTRLNFSVGILHGPSICDWHSWRHVQAWWSPEVWEKIGFDYRKFQRNSSGPQPFMDTMKFKNLIDFNAIQDPDMQILCDFIQIGINGATALDHSLRTRARLTTEDQMIQAYAAARNFGYSNIRDIDSVLPDRLKRMLAINMLFNYWQINDPFVITRPRHIKQLGLGGPSESGMSNDLAEAGCIPLSRSVLLTKLKQMCEQATRFFENHPKEFARLEEKYIEDFFYHQRHGTEQTPTGYSVPLPADARSRRKGSSKNL